MGKVGFEPTRDAVQHLGGNSPLRLPSATIDFAFSPLAHISHRTGVSGPFGTSRLSEPPTKRKEVKNEKLRFIIFDYNTFIRLCQILPFGVRKGTLYCRLNAINAAVRFLRQRCSGCRYMQANVCKWHLDNGTLRHASNCRENRTFCTHTHGLSLCNARFRSVQACIVLFLCPASLFGRLV